MFTNKREIPFYPSAKNLNNPNENTNKFLDNKPYISHSFYNLQKRNQIQNQNIYEENEPIKYFPSNESKNNLYHESNYLQKRNQIQNQNIYNIYQQNEPIKYFPSNKIKNNIYYESNNNTIPINFPASDDYYHNNYEINYSNSRNNNINFPNSNDYKRKSNNFTESSYLKPENPIKLHPNSEIYYPNHNYNYYSDYPKETTIKQNHSLPQSSINYSEPQKSKIVTSQKNNFLTNYAIYQKYDIISPSKYRNFNRKSYIPYQNDSKLNISNILQVFKNQIDICKILESSKIDFYQKNKNITTNNLFNFFDSNNSGKITISEFIARLKSMGINSDINDVKLLFLRYNDLAIINFDNFERMIQLWSVIKKNKVHFEENYNYQNKIIGLDKVLKTLLNFEISLENLRNEILQKIDFKEFFINLTGSIENSLNFEDFSQIFEKEIQNDLVYLFYLYGFDEKNINFDDFIKELNPKII